MPVKHATIRTLIHHLGKIIKSHTENDMPEIIAAIIARNTESLKRALAAGADVNIEYDSERTDYPNWHQA